jgi:uroporphyrin-3 C-methyltransferase
MTGSKLVTKKTSKKASKKVAKKTTASQARKSSESVISQEENQVSSTVADARESVQPKVIKETVQTKPAGRGLSWLALLVALGALGLSGFSFYQDQIAQLRNNSDLAVGVAEIGGNVSRLGDSINSLKAAQEDMISGNDLSVSLMQAKQSVDAELNQIKQQQEVLNESLANMAQDFQQGKNAFVLDEVDHLFRLAFNALQFNQDANAAKTALTQADALIQDLDDPKFLSVRKTLTADIEALQQIKRVDLTAASAKLNQMSQLIPSLPLVNEPETQLVDTADDANQSSEVERTWRTELNQIWQDIKGSVQVQRVDQPPKPLLAPEQRYFLNQNLQLNLNKADLALLQNNSVVYAQSLTTAKAWLTDYFDLKDSRVSEMSNQLDELAKFDMSVDLPDISASYSAFKSARGN